VVVDAADHDHVGRLDLLEGLGVERRLTGHPLLTYTGPRAVGPALPVVLLQSLPLLLRFLLFATSIKFMLIA